MPWLTRVHRTRWSQRGSAELFPPFRNANVLEIKSADDVPRKLAAISMPKRGTLSCTQSQVFLGQYLAQRGDKYLAIDDVAKELKSELVGESGVIVIEQDFDSADTVVAVSYAYSIGADVEFVPALTRDERQQVLDLLRAWRDGDERALARVAAKVGERVGAIDFDAYQFATFFTTGLPYSLVLENRIPFSSVALDLRPDLFVVNCILAESKEPFGSALVFCHDEFISDGEAEWLVEWLGRKNAIVRSLAGKEALVYNLDYNAQHFPYDVLHIVSHGGLMSGHAVRQMFVDRDGKSHVVEYDEVVGFQARPGRKKIGVNTMRIIRNFDGFVWRSQELAAQRLPKYVFKDMSGAIAAMENRSKTATQAKKDDIPASRAILCNDSFHHGTFRSLAAYTSPIIFNNACWSWSDIASFFLSSGARGYVGTYWGISNEAAVTAAKAFYESTTDATAMVSVHRANEAIGATDDADILMYWGLHFSTVQFRRSRADNLNDVLNALINELFLLIDSVPDAPSSDVLTNTFDAIRLINLDLRAKFQISNRAMLEDEVTTRLKGAISRLRQRRRAERIKGANV